MKNIRHPAMLYVFGVFMVVLFVETPWAAAEFDYIKISDPFLNKIPIAVPICKDMSGSAAEQTAALGLANRVSDALAFTGYFKMIDRQAFLEDPRTKGITGQEIQFDNWTDIGAELLITGGVSISNQFMEVEFRLFDTFKSELIFGKRYKGRPEDQRKIAHRFCGEVVRRLTGKQGVFDSRIAFVSTQTGNKEIFICDFDGYGVTPVSRTGSLSLFPSWSPDGSAIAYTSYQNNRPEIIIRNLSQKTEKKISYPGINITPVWVPGGKRMAATLSFEGDEEIYLLTEAGKIDKRVTKNWGIDVSPTFSPDGKKMAFVSKRFGTPQIFIQELDSGAVRRLTYEGKYNTQPDWSPVGDRIAYSAMENGQINIFTINADGRGIKRLTRDAGANESPTWSPDGSLIAFSSNRTGKSRIYVMTASGTDQRILLETPGEQTSPSWSLSLPEE